METLNTIWQTIAPYVTGLGIGGLISAVICGVLKGSFAKAIEKLNVEKVCEETVKKSIDKIKGVSFKQSIQPLAESELRKITESSNAYIEKYLKETQEKYDKLLNVLDKLACYFDNSVGVSDDAKKALHEAVELAKNNITEVETTLAPIVETKKETKTISTDVDR